MGSGRARWQATARGEPGRWGCRQSPGEVAPGEAALSRCMALRRAACFWRRVALALRMARLVARARTMAWRQGAWAAASARTARRSAARPVGLAAGFPGRAEARVDEGLRRVFTLQGIASF